MPWWFLLYSNFHRWGVIVRCFNLVSSFPLKICFWIVQYLRFLERKCIYSSNTSFPKLLERWDFVLGPQTRHANLPFVWRPARDGLMSIIWRRLFKKHAWYIQIIIYYKVQWIVTYQKNVLVLGNHELSIQVFHGIEITCAFWFTDDIHSDADP